MITVTLGQLFESADALQNLVGQKMPVKTAYWVKKVLDKADIELRNYNRLRLQVFRELGTEDDQGNITVPPERRDELSEKMNELNSIPVEIKWIPISPDELGPNVEISPRDLAMLEYLFLPDPEKEVLVAEKE